MKIETKYSIGDKVWRVEHYKEETEPCKCKECNGTGKFVLDGVQLYCQNCIGGMTRGYKDVYKCVQSTIYDISIELTKKLDFALEEIYDPSDPSLRIITEYHLDDVDATGYYLEDDLFPTRELAEASIQYE